MKKTCPILLFLFFLGGSFYPSICHGMDQAQQNIDEKRPLLKSRPSRHSPTPHVTSENGTLTIPPESLFSNTFLGTLPHSRTTTLVIEPPARTLHLPKDVLQILAEHFPLLRNFSIIKCSIPSDESLSFGKFKNLRSLTIRYGKLTPDSSRGFELLVHLKHLDLTGNILGDQWLEKMGPLAKLELLDLSHNYISEAGLPHLSTKFPNLNELGLALNRIGVSSAPDAGDLVISEPKVSCLLPLVALSELRSLDLSGTTRDSRRKPMKEGLLNFITADDLSCLCALHHLRVLKIGSHFMGNYSDTLQPRPLRPQPTFLLQFPQLRELIARQSGIGDEGVSIIGHLPQLEILDLSDGELTGSHLEELNRLSGLTCLSLNNHPLKSNANHLGLLLNLTSLSLMRCGLEGPHISSFGNLVNLTSLYLNSNNIRSGTYHLSRLTKLEVLDLPSNNIDDEAFGHLVPLKGLKKLSVQGTVGQLTPASSQNIAEFINGSQVETFDLSRVYFSHGEKRRALAEERVLLHEQFVYEDSHGIDFVTNRRTAIQMTAVWTRVDIRRLEALLRRPVPITKTRIEGPSSFFDCCTTH